MDNRNAAPTSTTTPTTTTTPRLDMEQNFNLDDRTFNSTNNIKPSPPVKLPLDAQISGAQGDIKSATSLQPTNADQQQACCSTNDVTCTNFAKKIVPTLSKDNNGKLDPKAAKLHPLLFENEMPDMTEIKSIAWGGIPHRYRPLCWRLLLGYTPVSKSKREQQLKRKLEEYERLIEQYYNDRSLDDGMWRQIHIDIPRMQPKVPVFQHPRVQMCFERILYIWSIRHPASGYVQGMNDLVTPFFLTYLSEYCDSNQWHDVETFDISLIDDASLLSIEADTYWSFGKLLDSIQNNYTHAQPGIQRLIKMLATVISRVDVNLHNHLKKNGVGYLQFAFRWMNNLLIRELPLRFIVRLWDSYLSENTSNSGNETPFSASFHLFVCAAFLKAWSSALLQENDFQGIMLTLQNLPTDKWGDKDIDTMLANAYLFKEIFTPSHLKT